MAVNLFVNRLYVLTDNDEVAYDEHFHHGINIIRGENSSGKSTITRLLFYGLGGDYTHFVPETRKCAYVLVEVSTGEATLTLSRRIDKDKNGEVKSMQGMTIHWGTLDEALAHRCESQTFGYKVTPNVRSFSNVLFDVMGIPIVQGDSNITMHQLLRLMFIDQESPLPSLFYYEQFDNQITRETVADLLMGIYDSDLYKAKIRLKELATQIDEAKAERRVLEATLPKGQRSTDYFCNLIEEKNKEIENIENQITKARRGEEINVQQKTQTQQQKDELCTLARLCNENEEAVYSLEHDIEDSRIFIAELESKSRALQQSISTRQVLGSLRLEYCPECLTRLSDNTPEGVCRLCKSRVDNHTGVTQAKRLIAELTFQIDEAKAILSRDEENLLKTKSQSRSLHRKYTSAQRSLDALLGTARSSMAEQIEDLNYRKGEVKGELLQLYTLRDRADYYEQLLKKQDTLKKEHDKIERYVDAKISRQQQRQREVMAKMQEHGVYLLHHDENRQKAFVHAQEPEFHVDFSNNIFYLQKRSDKYSASSTFFLKLVARFSLFFASLDIDWMRYPRFIFTDNMEDKGMEESRARKFQQTLIERLRKYNPDNYQVIYATSCLAPELEHSEYVVGDRYTWQNKSLKNV